MRINPAEPATIQQFDPTHHKGSKITDKVKGAVRDVAPKIKSLVEAWKNPTTDDSPIRVGNSKKKQVLLVHGLTGSPAELKKMKANLEKEGFEVHTVSPKYEKQGLEESVKKVREAAEAIAGEEGKLSIVGHSLGGVAAVRVATELANKVDRVITINSPLRGTKALKKFKGRLVLKIIGARDLIKPLKAESEDSKTLLKDAKTAGTKFFHIATNGDMLVNDLAVNFLEEFEEGMILKGGKGHLAALDAPETKTMVVRWLQSEDQKD